jgi:predicted nucleic acid-binding protein
VIILDTNVLSALMRDTPAAAVVAWLDTQSPESLWTTSITLFEIGLGLELLPVGRRRASLQDAFRELIDEDLSGRVLAFDVPAAAQAARLAAERQQAGRPVDFRDTQIAGIALARRAAIATRNLRHFEGLSVPVVNPWGESA